MDAYGVKGGGVYVFLPWSSTVPFTGYAKVVLNGGGVLAETDGGPVVRVVRIGFLMLVGFVAVLLSTGFGFFRCVAHACVVLLAGTGLGLFSVLFPIVGLQTMGYLCFRPVFLQLGFRVVVPSGMSHVVLLGNMRLRYLGVRRCRVAKLKFLHFLARCLRTFRRLVRTFLARVILCFFRVRSAVFPMVRQCFKGPMVQRLLHVRGTTTFSYPNVARVPISLQTNGVPILVVVPSVRVRRVPIVNASRSRVIGLPRVVRRAPFVTSARPTLF